MDVLTYYRKLGAGESSPHGMEREFYSATVSSVMEKQRDNSNICFEVGDGFRKYSRTGITRVISEYKLHNIYRDKHPPVNKFPKIIEPV